MSKAQHLEDVAADWLARSEEPQWSAADAQALADWLAQWT
jgi:hypothetical protein